MKLLSTLVFIIVLYIAPLAGAPDLLLNSKLIVMIGFCAALLWSQPAIDFHDAEEKRNTDKHSVFVILLGSALSQLAVMIEYGYFNHTFSASVKVFNTLIGLALMSGGTAFRIHAIRTLGKFFTATVQVQSNQRIIQIGPYAHLRHPSYLGAFVALIGSALFMNSVVSALITGMVMIIAYKIRITAEEKTLLTSFGEEYSSYQKKTFGMLPLIW